MREIWAKWKSNMRLITKLIIIISFIVISIITLMFYVLGNHFDKQIDNHLLTTARIVYKNILLVRQWVAGKDGIFHIKHPGDEANPYLPHPEIISQRNDTLLLKNPAILLPPYHSLISKCGKSSKLLSLTWKF